MKKIYVYYGYEQVQLTLDEYKLRNPSANIEGFSSSALFSSSQLRLTVTCPPYQSVSDLEILGMLKLALAYMENKLIEPLK